MIHAPADRPVAFLSAVVTCAGERPTAAAMSASEHGPRQRRSISRKASATSPGGADRAAALADRENYSLDVGGAYSITRRIAVTGGVRYNVERERSQVVEDNRRDSQAVYVGTAFKF